jgi:hypothetical protein
LCRLAAQAIPDGNARRHARPTDQSRGIKQDPMTDLYILVILIGVIAAMAGYLLLVDRVR